MKSRYPQLKKRTPLWLLIFFVVAILWVAFGDRGGDDSAFFSVNRVIVGDTIELTTGEKVRYIGIDAPELHHPRKSVRDFAIQSKEANRKLVEGKEVRLEFDVQKRDRYERLLAYMYMDTIFVNAWLVQHGFALVKSYPPNLRHQELFRRLQSEARENQLGLWQEGMSPSPDSFLDKVE